MTDAWDAFPVAKPAAYPAKADFTTLADKTFGKGNWSMNSGYRDPAHNRAVGGVPNSNHTKGADGDPGAYDISVKGLNSQQAAAKLKAAGWGGTDYPESNHLHVNSPEMAGWDAFPKADAGTAPKGPVPSQRGTPGVYAQSRQPGVGEATTLGGSIGARFEEGASTLGRLSKHERTHPLDRLDPRRLLEAAGGVTDMALSPLTGAVDAGVQAIRKGFTPDPDLRARQSDPAANRKMGDLAAMATPLPKFGAVAEGVRDVGQGLKAERGAASAVKASDTAAKAADTAKAAREATLHKTRVAMLQKAGVRDLTPGQVKGGAARAKEVAQTQGGLAQKAYTAQAKRANDSFQRGTYNTVLEDIGMTYPSDGPVGNSGVKAVNGFISRAYDRILPHVKLNVDKKLTDALAVNVSKAEDLRNPEASNFYRSVDRSVRSQLEPGAVIDGKTFKEIESDLTRDIASLKANPLHRREADLLDQYLTILREGAERSSSPAVAKRLKAVNDSYAKMTKVQEAAQRNTGAGGHFDTVDLLEAVKKGDTSPRNQRFARGEAHMQRWADVAHQVMGQGAEGERAPGLHVPYPSPHGVVTAAARTVAGPVAETLAARSMQRARDVARRKVVRDKLYPRRKTGGAGKAVAGALPEAAVIQGEDEP